MSRFSLKVLNEIRVLSCVKRKVECTYMFMAIGAIRYPYNHISNKLNDNW